MFYNHLKIALRGLKKQKQFALLNFFGLTLGICISGLLLLYILDELSFDKHHKNLDQIYRVIVNVDWDGEKEKWASAPNAVGPVAVDNIAGVKNHVRFLRHNFGQLAFIQIGDKKITESNLYWSDPTLANIFNITFIEKKSDDILHAPNQVVISQSTADKLFASENPMGKLVRVDNTYDLEIVGIYEDFPNNSLLDAHMIGSFETMHWAKNLSWGNSSFETFLLLEPEISPDAVESLLVEMLDNYVEKTDQWYSLGLQPLRDIHLQSDDISNAYSSHTGDAKQIKILCYLALIIIMIACINYMNMATARSQNRFKEVGINKTLGASRNQLIRRFYIETSFMVLLSLVFSFLLISVFLPLFNEIADKRIDLKALYGPSFLGGLLGLSIIVILISGAYPALYLSSFTPANLFVIKISGKLGGSPLRKILVVTQFVASIIIIVSTLVFNNQLNFIQNENLGYKPNMVIGIHTSGAESEAQAKQFITKLRTLPSVVSAAHVQTFPGNGGSGYAITNPRDERIGLPVEANRASPNILEVLNLELIAGKTLPDRMVSNEDSVFQVILNEKAIHFLGYTPEDAIGKEAPGLFYNARAQIVGVVKDFHFESFHRPIGGYVLHNRPSERNQYALAKLKTEDLAKSLATLQNMFYQTIPTSAFEYTFLDQHLETLYYRENRTARIFLIFAILSIFIACLGLFGLTAYTIEQRTKEIGVRKILGASVSRITILLSQDFLRLVFLAILISIPLSWYFINSWLQNFAFRIDVSGWVFFLAGLFAIVFAVLTVGLQGIKAALVNPVRSLRNE